MKPYEVEPGMIIKGYGFIVSSGSVFTVIDEDAVFLGPRRTVDLDQNVDEYEELYPIGSDEHLEVLEKIRLSMMLESLGRKKSLAVLDKVLSSYQRAPKTGENEGPDTVVTIQGTVECGRCGAEGQFTEFWLDLKTDIGKTGDEERICFLCPLCHTDFNKFMDEKISEKGDQDE